MATMDDIAKKLGISKGTVSKAFNGAPDVSETLRKTVLETAVELGYSRARRGAARRLCIFVENMGYTSPDDFGWDIITGFRKMAEPAGYEVEVIPLDNNLQRQIHYDEYMLQGNYLGAVLLGLTLADHWMRDFRTSKTPAVLFDNRVRANPRTTYLGADNEEGMELAVACLRELGHRKIGYLSGGLTSYINQVRYTAFFRSLRKNALPDDPALGGSSYFSSECLDVHLPRMLSNGVTAIMCGTDLLAHTVMIRCAELGLRIPEDLSIIGFDDLPFCAYTMPPLSSIRQDRTEIGRSAYFALSSLLNNVPHQHPAAPRQADAPGLGGACAGGAAGVSPGRAGRQQIGNLRLFRDDGGIPPSFFCRPLAPLCRAAYHREKPGFAPAKNMSGGERIRPSHSYCW